MACGAEFEFNPDFVCSSCNRKDRQFCLKCHNYNHRFMPLANMRHGNKHDNYLRFAISFMVMGLGIASSMVGAI